MVHLFLAITGVGRVKELDALESKPHCRREEIWPVLKLALPRAETPGHFRTIEETFKTQDIKMSRFHFQPSSNESRPGT